MCMILNRTPRISGEKERKAKKKKKMLQRKRETKTNERYEQTLKLILRPHVYRKKVNIAQIDSLAINSIHICLTYSLNDNTRN